MSTKREERRQRSELERQARERRQQQRKLRSRMFIVVGVLAVLGVVVLALGKRQEEGRVWSPEHGHWHDK